jgi:hypothetical protein
VHPTGGAPDVLVMNPSFSVHVIPILERRCSIGGCHSLAAAQGGLVLAPAYAYDALVGVRAALDPRFLRVVSMDPDTSWIMRMIGEDPAGRGGRVRMPLSSMPLTPNQIGTIRNWIADGARRD